VAAVILCAVFAACSRDVSQGDSTRAAAEMDRPLEIITVNYPLAYFAERILGDHGSVSFPAPADVDPAYWSPAPEIISEYQQADLILLNGAGYAAWTANATLPRSGLVNTTAAITDRLIPVESTVTHTHGPAGDHSHGDTAFTTWLDPGIAIEQARAVLDAVVHARPQHEADFRNAFESLESDLTELDSQLQEMSEQLGKQPVLFSHPVYQYLERRYNLRGFSVHWEPDEVPEEAQWRQLQSVLQQHPATIMIWEAEPLEETRRRLLDLGVDSVIFAPGGNRPAGGDLLDLMHEGIASLSMQ
jgi:zinc transport system substrate-binding protein